MSNYYYPEQPPRRSGFVWFSIVLVIIAMVLGGMLLISITGALDRGQPEENQVESVQPTQTQPSQSTQAQQPQATPYVLPTQAPQDSSTDSVAQVAYFPDIVDQVESAVVSIVEGRDLDHIQVGSTARDIASGVIISQDGYIVTNYHVIDGQERVNVVLSDGRELNAQILGMDRYTELAVLKVEAEGLTAIELGSSDALRAGEWVLAIGNPLGQQGSVTAGIVSATDREMEINGVTTTMIQTDTAINPGNSGGALVNMQGQLVGINTIKTVYAGYSETGSLISAEGIGFAIPIDVAKPIIQNLIEKGFVERPAMGVSGQQISEEEARYYGWAAGFYVGAVATNGSAGQAGIQPGDIITGIDGRTVSTFNDIYAVINAKNIGDTVQVQVWRNGETLTMDVMLTSSEAYNNATYTDEVPQQEEQQPQQEETQDPQQGSVQPENNAWPEDALPNLFDFFPWP